VFFVFFPLFIYVLLFSFSFPFIVFFLPQYFIKYTSCKQAKLCAISTVLSFDLLHGCTELQQLMTNGDNQLMTFRGTRTHLPVGRKTDFIVHIVITASLYSGGRKMGGAHKKTEHLVVSWLRLGMKCKIESFCSCSCSCSCSSCSCSCSCSSFSLSRTNGFYKVASC
jgi:hypothetical protein